MKAVIVGANSYIARNLLYILKRRKPECEVKLYDYTETHIDGESNYTKINILDRESVSKIDMDCDAVFMFVGKTGSAEGFDNYGTFVNVNEMGLVNLIDEYRRQKSGAKIIYPSTRLVYKGGDKPLRENAPKEFKTVYAINKFACEQYLEQYSQIYGVKYCVFRICIPYGTLIPGASSYGTIGFMLNRASEGKNITLYGDGSARRTFTHIEDVCGNLIDGAFSDKCVNDVFNIGGEDMSLKEVAKLIASEYGVKVENVPYPNIAEMIESGDTVFNAGKLANAGIRSRFKIEEWIKEENVVMDVRQSAINQKISRGGVICPPDLVKVLHIAPAPKAA